MSAFENLNADQALPLNASQRRALTVALAGIELDLRRVAEVAERRPCDGRLTSYTEPLPVDSAAAIADLSGQILQKVHQLANDLNLEAREESIRRSLAAALLLDEVGIEEVEPPRLGGYGTVDAATAEYLNRELPQLRLLLRRLTGAVTGQVG